MKKILVFIAILAGIACSAAFSQKKYGYAILNFRCGEDDPQRNRRYYSPVIELNILNFPQYTDGMDPSIPQYSVRYYNYAISKWFEIYLKDKYKILINTRDKYARKSGSIIFNEKNKRSCDDNKTNSACFFLNKQELSLERKNAIQESMAPANEPEVCEVIDL